MADILVFLSRDLHLQCLSSTWLIKGLSFALEIIINCIQPLNLTWTYQIYTFLILRKSVGDLLNVIRYKHFLSPLDHSR